MPRAPTIYETHDNGGRPFRVEIDGKTVRIFKQGPKDNEEEKTKLIKEYDVKEVIVGRSSGRKQCCDHTRAQARKFDGNSLLLKIKDNEYIFVGHEIFKLTMKDELEEYYSPVGPNDVPYPLILGKQYVYFLLDKKYVERSYFPSGQIWECAYEKWYGEFDPKYGWQSIVEPFSKKMQTKQIVKRSW